MTDLNFDLNIYNYTNDELKKFLFIENSYTADILKKKINILKKNIFSLHLSKREKNEFEIFFNKMELRLLKDLEKIEIKRVQNELNNKIKILKNKFEEKNGEKNIKKCKNEINYEKNYEINYEINYEKVEKKIKKS